MTRTLGEPALARALPCLAVCAIGRFLRPLIRRWFSRGSLGFHEVWAISAFETAKAAFVREFSSANFRAFCTERFPALASATLVSLCEGGDGTESQGSVLATVGTSPPSPVHCECVVCCAPEANALWSIGRMLQRVLLQRGVKITPKPTRSQPEANPKPTSHAPKPTRSQHPEKKTTLSQNDPVVP